mgnify:CR=1 FL=1
MQRSEDLHDIDNVLISRLRFATALTGVVFLAELAGGYATNSLALISDAVHVFMDVLALGLSWFAIYISALPPTETRTYGMHRIEVFVSFINGMLLVFATVFIFYKAYFRFLHPETVESAGMMIVAAIGLAVNLLVAFSLKDHAKTDLNIKSAFLHVVGDAAASVGVIIAAIVIRYTGWNAIDPLISVVIGLIIVGGAIRIIRESAHILLEGVPGEVSLTGVTTDIKKVAGVTGVHSLHIWSICTNIFALSAHVDIEPKDRARFGEILSEINERLARDHHIFYTTIQAECLGCDTGRVLRRFSHKGKRGHAH